MRTMFDFSGQTVLMIGGVSDLAAGVARAFSEAGAQLLIAHPSGSDQLLLSTYPEASRIEVSLDAPEALALQLADYTLNTAVICPGWFDHRPFMESKYSDVEDAYRINFEQSTYAAQAAAKRMIVQREGGAIVFLSSVVSKTPMIETNLVGSSLASIEVIATMSAVELAPHDIRVNVVAAGWIEGSWSTPLAGANGQLKEPSDIPAGKLGTAKSVGNACCFLASPMADYITGIVLPVDGGFMLTKSAAKSPYFGS